MLEEFLERNAPGKTFHEYEVKWLLKDMGFSVPEGHFIRRNAGEGFQKEINLSYPLVAKVSSTKIASKSDVKGVHRGLRDEYDLVRAVNDLLKIKDAEGVLIEEMAPEGLEVIIGGTIDQQFGPIVIFGGGGLLVELNKDVAFALAPLKRDDALWLVKQVKAYRLLEGYRGRPAVNRDSLLDLVVAISELISTGLISEIELNPVALYADSAIILDAGMKAK